MGEDGIIQIATQTSVTVADGVIEVEVGTANKGDEPACNVHVQLMISGKSLGLQDVYHFRFLKTIPGRCSRPHIYLGEIYGQGDVFFCLMPLSINGIAWSGKSG